MAPMLRVRLFGAFEVSVDGAPVTLTSSRARSLLAYLALRAGPQRRERVAGALWPGSTDRQARTNLRHVLHTLRGGAPEVERHLLAAGETLALRDVATDVAAFDAALDGGADTMDTLRAAADLYTGDLLEGWYDDWLAADRDAYRQRVTTALLFAALLDLDLDDRPALRGRVHELTGLRPRVEAAPIRLFTEAMAGLLDVLDGSVRPGLARVDAALADPARAANPGVPAMLLRIRLAAALAAGPRDEACDTARRLLADGVRVWDALATAVLAGER